MGEDETAGTGQAAPPPPPRERRWLPAFGVLLVIAAVVLGGFLVSGDPSQAVADTEPDPGTPPIEVIAGVRVTPLPGWEEGGGFTEPVLGVRITSGAATLDVFAAQAIGLTPQDLFLTYLNETLVAQSEQLRSSEQLEAIAAPSGLQGVRGSYVGTFTGVAAPIEGELSAFVSPGGVGVIFDGWAPEGQLGIALGEIRAMVETLEVDA